MKKYLSDDRLFILIRDFLTEYLPKQRFCSINTIDSYRATLNLLLDYVCVSMQIGLHQVTFECIDADVLAHFWIGWRKNEAVLLQRRTKGLLVFDPFTSMPGRRT